MKIYCRCVKCKQVVHRSFLVMRITSQWGFIYFFWAWPDIPSDLKGAGKRSSVCALDPTSSSNFSGGPVKAGSPSKTPFFCPSPPGRAASNIYAKSTSPNCRISLQTKFLLSPLTTAVNYKAGRGGAQMWATVRGGDAESWWKKSSVTVRIYQLVAKLAVFQEDLPD